MFSDFWAAQYQLIYISTTYQPVKHDFVLLHPVTYPYIVLADNAGVIP